MNPNLAKLSFLLVDDDESSYLLTEKLLSVSGITNTTVAVNGKDAIEKLIHTARPVDVIICDLNMPVMDGIQFLRHLAALKYPGNLILLSGEDERILSSAYQLAQAHKLNIVSAISKPISKEQLQSSLAQVNLAVEGELELAQVPIDKDELITGLKEGALEFVLQPKVEISSGKTTGAEVLARWNHSSRGLLEPGSFIPLAEEIGAINELTRVIYTKAIEQIKQWQQKNIDLKISVNIPMDSLEQLSFFDFIVESIETDNIDPQRVILEITETQIMKNVAGALETLTRLGMKRVGLSIDDFGTGYSSMEQLKQIPFTELKVDRAFVFGADQDASMQAILESSIELARKLNLEIVAEGVETQADWDLLSELGCDYAQGYYYAKPMSSDDFESWIES